VTLILSTDASAAMFWSRLAPPLSNLRPFPGLLKDVDA